MAIAFSSSGSGNHGTSSAATIPYPASPSAGDLLVAMICNKYPTNGPATPSGWTLASGAQQNGGSGTDTSLKGHVYATVYYKIATGSESGSLAVTITGVNEWVAVMHRYTKGASNVWQVTATGGSDNNGTDTVNHSITTAANPGTVSGDLVLVAWAVNEGAYTRSTEAITATGVTLGAVTERNDLDASDADQCGLFTFTASATAGTSSTTMGLSFVSSSSSTDRPCGAAVLINLHELSPQTITVGSAIATGFSSGSPAVTQQIKPTTIGTSFVGGGPVVLATTAAIITQPAQTMHIAGYTVEQFSGFDSTVDGIIDVDIVHWAWDFGDGSTAVGPNVHHTYATAGTRTTTLVVTTDAGHTASTTVDTTTVDFTGTTYYVASTGNDANSGLSTGSAKLTIASALTAIGTPSQGSPKKLLLNKGDTFTWTTPRPVGPLIMDSYGTGAAPIVNVTGDLFWNPANAWGYSLFFFNLNFQYAARGDHEFQAWVSGTTYSNCTINNGCIVQSYLAGDGISIIGCTISNSDYLGVYSSTNWTTMTGCTLFGHGADNVHHHQSYLSVNNYVELRTNEYYKAAGIAYSGQKTSGVRKLYVADCYTHDNSVGFDGGANIDDRQAEDIIYERNNILNDNVAGASAGGIWMNWGVRVVIRNNLIVGASKAALVIGGFSGKNCDGVRITGNTIYGSVKHDLLTDDHTANIVFKNNIIHRIVNCNVGSDIAMIYTSAAGANAALTSDYNFFYSSSPATDTSASTCFAQDGTGRTFTTWKSTAGQDAHSTFGDPGMTSPGTGDYTIGTGSAAKDAGVALPIMYDDYVQNRRPSGAGFDVGAYEYTATTNTLRPTAIGTSFASSPATLKMKILPTTIISASVVGTPSVKMQLKPTTIATGESVPTTASVSGGSVSGGGGGSPPQIVGPTVYGPNVLVGCLHVGLANSWVTLNDGAAGQPGGTDKGEVISGDNTNDKASGNGALTARVEYLDVTGTPKTETFTLNGSGVVLATRSDWWRVNDFFCTSYGSSGANAGALTLRKNSASTNWAQIRVAGKSAAMGQFTVPLGYAFYLQGAQFGISVITSATPLRVTVQLEAEIDRHTGAYAAGVWTTIGWATGSVFTPPIIGPFPPGSYIRIPALATIRARAITDNASAIEIAGGFYGALSPT